MNVEKEILLEAAKLIRKGWCKEVTAKDNLGEPTHPWSAQAIRFCAMGAIQRACFNKGGFSDKPLYARVRRYIGEESIADWNDSIGQSAENVVKTLEKVAESYDPRKNAPSPEPLC